MAENCKICKLDQDVESHIDHQNDNRLIKCPRCGYYELTDHAYLSFPLPNSDEEMALFSGHIRNNSYRGKRILITTKMLLEIPQIVLPYKNISVLEKINKVILYIGKNSKYVGDHVVINSLLDYTLFFCHNFDEFVNISNHLLREHTVEIKKVEVYKTGYSLTISGWEKFEKIREININSKQAFIAMNFDPTYDDLYKKAIEQACIDCGFNPLRIDRVHHNEKICDKIISEIRQSRFVIADFSGQKHGVYFEAGYAQGMGIPVIWSCKKQEIENKEIHFDTRQYNHIAWETPEELREGLINRIKATIK